MIMNPTVINREIQFYIRWFGVIQKNMLRKYLNYLLLMGYK